MSRLEARTARRSTIAYARALGLPQPHACVRDVIRDQRSDRARRGPVDWSDARRRLWVGATFGWS